MIQRILAIWSLVPLPFVNPAWTSGNSRLKPGLENFEHYFASMWDECNYAVVWTWSPVAYWAPTDLGSSSFSVLSFCLFILFMGFSRQEYCHGLPFLSPVDHILSELSTMTCLSWVALHGMAHSFIELDKAVVHVIRLVSFMWLWFSFYLPSDGEE